MYCSACFNFTEIEFADTSKVPIVAVIFEQKFKPTKWLKFLLGNSLWHDLSNSDTYQLQYEHFLDAIAVVASPAKKEGLKVVSFSTMLPYWQLCLYTHTLNFICSKAKWPANGRQHVEVLTLISIFASNCIFFVTLSHNLANLFLGIKRLRKNDNRILSIVSQSLYDFNSQPDIINI